MRALLTTISLVIFSQSFSQKILITYYDDSWLLTPKEFAKHYRAGIIDTNKYLYYGEVKDYYMNGNLQMKGNFVANIKIDTFYFYYPSGKLKSKGNYSNNIRSGIWTNYYENGNVKDRIAFNRDFVCALEYYDENGNPKMINGTGEWETEYYDEVMNEKTNLKGYFKDTLRHGTWNYYNTKFSRARENPSNEKRLECTEEYNYGKFLRGKYYWGGGNIQDINEPTMIILPETKKFERLEKWSYSKYASIEAYPRLKFLPKVDSSVFPVDIKAEFPGGVDSLTKVFVKNMKFSKSYIAAQKSRSTFFLILINEEGKLKITEDPNGAALRSFPDNQIYVDQVKKTIKNLPNWEPAKRNSKNVKNSFMLVVEMTDGNIGVQLMNMN